MNNHDSRSYHEINIHKLEEEWVNQVAMYRYAAEELADANYAFRKAETEVKVREKELKETKARLYLEIRRDPEKFDLPSRSETTFDSAVLIQPSYKEAQEAVFEAEREKNKLEHERDIFEAAEKTIGFQRKKAIEDLVQLEGRAYFARPRVTNSVEIHTPGPGGRPHGVRRQDE